MGEILKWLEPTIENRVSEISDDILGNNKNNGYLAFMELLRGNQSISPELKMELGDMFISHTQDTVEESYKKGIKDILRLRG